MELQKVKNLLGTTLDEMPRFTTKNWMTDINKTNK